MDHDVFSDLCAVDLAGLDVIRTGGQLEKNGIVDAEGPIAPTVDEQLTAVAETLITIAAAATLIRRWP